MTRRSSPPHPHPGLTAALAIVRLVMQLVEAIFADLGDLPDNHPDRRSHARLCRELQRAETRILAEIAALDEAQHHTTARATTNARPRQPRQAATLPPRPNAARPRPGRGPPAPAQPKTYSHQAT